MHNPYGRFYTEEEDTHTVSKFHVILIMGLLIVNLMLAAGMGLILERQNADMFWSLEELHSKVNCIIEPGLMGCGDPDYK